jgi:signal transduction histidine kinase
MPNGIWVESVLSPELTDDNEVSAVITISRNISARKRVERELEEYSQMQELLMLLASSFINLPIEMVDAAINTALFKVAEFLGADRAYIFHYNFVEQQGTVCHEWCGENIPLRFVGDEKTVSLHTFKPWTVPHRKGRPLHVPDVRVLADSSQLRSNLEQTGVRSLIAVPMMDGRECLGFVGFETIMEPHFFSEKEQQLLIILAQLMISVNLRRQTEQRLVAQSSLQELIAHIASSFVGVKITNYEQKFLETLQVTGEHLGVDRVVLFLFTPDTVLGQNILEWCATGFASRKNVLNPHPFYHASAERRREFLAKQPILHFSDVNDMPKDFAVWQSGLRTLGVKSALFLSIHTDQHIYGVLGFETLGKKTEWSKNQINGLSVLAQILGSTLENISSSQALIEAKRSLEQRVAERTKELEVLVAEKDRTLQELSVAQSSLLEASRQAGMAEVATNVLHNVGNVLNSVNVSGTLLVEQLKHSRVANVAKIAELLANAPQEPARFLLEDPRGRQVPEYLGSLAIALQKERHTMLHEVELLNSRINHIKEIVAMQQDYGQVYGVLETIRPDQLMEDALKLNSGALQRHGVRVRRDYDPVPSITIDKHKVLQILLNLINNAKYACDEGGEEEKIITLQLHMHGKDRLRMQVSDNGVGITPENIGKIFQHGFTTRKSGHGFGLHSGALAAKSLGGRLSVASDGPGKGATFSLELPIVRGEDNAT